MPVRRWPRNGIFHSPGQEFNTPEGHVFDELGNVNNVPHKHTPPWDESSPIDAPDPILYDITFEPQGVTADGAQWVHEHQDLPPHLPWQSRARVLEDYYWNDDQQQGLGVPPGAPNDQPFQSGHTQITILNQSAEQGWGQDPKLRWPLYPHYQNSFPDYAVGIARRNGQWTAEKNFLQMVEYISPAQARDMRLRATKQHRQFGVVVADAPSVPGTWTVTPLEQLPWDPVTVGLEGIGPDW